jgi:hypothetical protein
MAFSNGVLRRLLFVLSLEGEALIVSLQKIERIERAMTNMLHLEQNREQRQSKIKHTSER